MKTKPVQIFSKSKKLYWNKTGVSKKIKSNLTYKMFCFSTFSTHTTFSLSVSCDEFVWLLPAVSAIINHMALHLLHTHTGTHTLALSRSRKSSVWLRSAICIFLLSGPAKSNWVWVPAVPTPLTWNPLYRCRYSRWQRPHTLHHVGIYSPNSHYSPARSVGPRSLANIRICSGREIRMRSDQEWSQLLLHTERNLFTSERLKKIHYKAGINWLTRNQNKLWTRLKIRHNCYIFSREDIGLLQKTQVSFMQMGVQDHWNIHMSGF